MLQARHGAGRPRPCGRAGGATTPGSADGPRRPWAARAGGGAGRAPCRCGRARGAAGGWLPPRRAAPPRRRSARPRLRPKPPAIRDLGPGGGGLGDRERVQHRPMAPDGLAWVRRGSRPRPCGCPRRRPAATSWTRTTTIPWSTSRCGRLRHTVLPRGAHVLRVRAGDTGGGAAGPRDGVPAQHLLCVRVVRRHVHRPGGPRGPLPRRHARGPLKGQERALAGPLFPVAVHTTGLSVVCVL
jgi:hypothetical protein